jgi:type II secretory pathway component GspD/PulD (secretin)
MKWQIVPVLLLAAGGLAFPLPAQEAEVSSTAQGVTINIVDADLRAAVQSLARYLDRPVVFGAMEAHRITLQTPQPVPPGDVPALLRATLESQGYELVDDGSAFRVRQKSPSQQAGLPSAQQSPQNAGGGPVELFVLRLRHARAADVAATVNALYGRAGALGERGEPARTLGDDLRQNRIQPFAEAASAPVAISGGRAATISGELVLVPDARTNSLLVRASRSDFELVAAAVNQLDVRPLQVVIEVLIAEVRRSSSFAIGVSATLGQQHIPGTTNTTAGGKTTGVGRQNLVLEVLNIGGVDLDLLISAGVERGAVSVLSRPILFATNNEPAEIVVGDQRPFVQVQRTTDGGLRDQIVQYKDVGTRLSVVPTISDNGYVQLQVVQEVNNATSAGTLDNPPVISTRSIQTALLVKDGRTAVLGGLAERMRERGSSGIPILSSIPVIGAIFGGKSRSTSDTELFVFLTPRILRGDEDVEDATTAVQRQGGAAGKLARKSKPLAGSSEQTEKESGPVEVPSPEPQP